MMVPGSWITDPESRILDQDDLECHTLLAKSMKKRDTSSVLTDFLVQIIEDAWSVTLFLLKNMIKCNTPSVFTDLR